MSDEAPTRRSSSPPWHRALERYREELGNPEDYRPVLDIHSLEELLDSLGSAQPSHIGRQLWLGSLISLRNLASRLEFVDNFCAVVTLCHGADPSLTAAVWGSIRLILYQAASVAENFHHVVDMLEELNLSLPRFQVYENTLPMNPRFQNALVDVYAEVICFYARAIHFFQNHPPAILKSNSWDMFRNDFSHTIMRMKRMALTLETEADLARTRKDDVDYRQALDLVKSMRIKRQQRPMRARYNNIPFPMNSRFTGRRDLLASISEALSPDPAASSLQSMAMFGMGGVGKTQTALQYVYENLDSFDVVLWVAADNAISMGQSLRTISQGLGLLGSEGESKDAVAAAWRVVDWLISSRSSWLVVFDNADDAVTLRTAWPRTNRGSVLVTTRDSAVAIGVAAQYIQVDTLAAEQGKTLLLRAAGLANPSSAEEQCALDISERLGGLPLALAQIGTFIMQRRLRLQDFPSLYERNSAKINSRKAASDAYEHSLSTVWDMSLRKLPGESAHLLNLFAFLDPESISEDIFLQGSHGLDRAELGFLSDEMDLGDASERLLRGALVSRTADDASYSVHRLVQSTVMERIPANERIGYFDAVVHLLSWGFSNHLSGDNGHQISSRAHLEKTIPHVSSIIEVSKRYNVQPGDRSKHGQLILRCGWYLFLQGKRLNYRGGHDRSRVEMIEG